MAFAIGRLPQLIIRRAEKRRVFVAGQDKVFTIAEEAATAKAYDITVEVVPTAHDMMLEWNWQLVADRVLVGIDTTVP